MRKLILFLLCVIMLTGCSKTDIKTDTISIKYGDDKTLFITDKTTGAEYGFKTVRVRKGGITTKAKTVNTDTIYIEPIGRNFRIIDKVSGAEYNIKN